MEKIEILEKVGKYLLSGEQKNAKMLINKQYPFRHMEATGRTYTDKQNFPIIHIGKWKNVTMHIGSSFQQLIIYTRLRLAVPILRETGLPHPCYIILLRIAGLIKKRYRLSC